ncbi:MAG: aminotransferase class V-fold PLP-dependent enzyme [Defluviitaleaceae bacterium]|nr:aminotransferase class V-fold PLP-dependent enzyme [Defluviitaleaceae bacterium]
MVEMYGLDAWVAHGSGIMLPGVNLDNAATTPPFLDVARAVQRHLRYYGSVGRGTGQKSKHSSAFYEEGRKTILDFVGANEDKYTVFYANNTTDGINKLASALTAGGNVLVVSTRMEHHANDLPWRGRAHMEYAEVDADGRLVLEDFERILRRGKYKNMAKYVTVTAASNVTGYVNDVHEIARIAHKHGAQIIVDGAQIVAHRQFSMGGRPKADEDIDFFVFSAHKMYSPYGGGAVVGRKDVLAAHMPQFCGGGMVVTVSDDDVVYAEVPDLYEAGSPNVPGIVGMLTAMKTLKKIGFKRIARHEQKLLGKALGGLSKINNVVLYGDSTNIADRVGILVFNIIGRQPEDVASQLACRAGIAVRHAAFCAHPYVRRLEGAAPHELCGKAQPPKGMVRISFGIYNTEDDVDLLLRTVAQIADDGAARAAECVAQYEAQGKAPNDRG